MNFKLKEGLSGFQLKLIGIVLMTIDHIYQMFSYFGAPVYFNMIGRSVAPIFMFLSVEGFTHTKSKKKYLLHLLIAYYIMFFLNSFFKSQFYVFGVDLTNNIFGTIFLAVFTMFCLEKITTGIKEKKTREILIGILGIFFLLFLTFITYFLIKYLNSLPEFNLKLYRLLKTIIWIFPNPIFVEGSFIFALFGVVLYIFRNIRFLQVITILLLGFLNTNFKFYDLFSWNYSWMVVFSIPFILLYNGKRGKNMKWLFYIYYPLHIHLLYVLAYFYSRTYF